jgi:hypothetical protein
LVLSSRRRRRQLLWLAVAAGAAAGIAVLGLEYPGNAPERSPVTNEPSQLVPPQPKSVRLTAARKAVVQGVAAEFVSEAVFRQHVGRSYRITAPELREGLTRAQWATGSIPVVPYPADQVALVKSKVDYSYADRVGLDVLIMPKRGSDVPSAIYVLEVAQVGAGPNAHWAVSRWAPIGSSDPLAGRSPAYGLNDGHKNPLSAMWLFVPVGLLGLIVLVPLLLGARGWRRHARVRRANRHLSRALPPSPLGD